MKVNDPNLSPASGHLPATGPSQAKQAERTSHGTRGQEVTGKDGASRDDVHLSELVRSLRSLAAESPERQERLEQIARTYADGTYQVNAPATAQGIIEDALRYR